MKERSPEMPSPRSDMRLEPPTLPHRRAEKISESVARDIVQDMRGLPVATMLPSEAAMLEKYGVGRASLREALRILEVQGLIVMRPGPGGGPMVAPIESRYFARTASLYLHLSGAVYRDVMEARLVMEPVMARLAAERQDAATISALERFRTPEALSSLDDTAYFRSSTDFHSLLSSLSGNPVLDFMGGALKDIYTDRLESMVFPPDARRRVQHDHAQISEAILDADPARAEQLMREHMLEFVQYSSEHHPGVLDEVVGWA